MTMRLGTCLTSEVHPPTCMTIIDYTQDLPRCDMRGFAGSGGDRRVSSESTSGSGGSTVRSPLTVELCNAEKLPASRSLGRGHMDRPRREALASRIVAYNLIGTE